LAEVRFGLIGYGAWGTHHARSINAVKQASLVAIAGHSPESCERARQEHPSARIYADYREMLQKESLDAVDVVLPSDLHHSVSCDVLRSGRHLLLEKPMTLSIPHCTELIQLAEENKRLLAIGHELRMSSLWGKVKELINEGTIGEPLYALIELWRRPYRLGSSGWRYAIDRVGSWILEEPIHFFDLARWYFSAVGDPVSVYAQANGRDPGHPELQDNFSAIISFPRGRYAVISQTLAAWQHHQTVKITGTKGALWAKWSGAMDRTFAPTFQLEIQTDGEPKQVTIEKPSGEVYELVDQIERFTDAILNGRSVPCTGEDGRWSVAMCLRAEESLRTGMPVSLSDMGVLDA
jgi:myo-inositol 2-dehydrogenase/D-chiro-inositol 1-dehydrogenase